MRQQFLVGELAEPVRLDRYLAGRDDIPLSRTQIERLIDEGGVTVSGSDSPNKKLLLRGGEEILLTFPAPPEREDLLAESIPLAVVYEDSSLAVIDKPARLITHPGAGVHSGTLVNALLGRYGTLPTLDVVTDDDAPPDADAVTEAAMTHAISRPGLVHRLDKNTSGLLLVARTDNALRALSAQMSRREISRSYLAIVFGHLKEMSGTIQAPIGRSPRDRKKMAVVSSGRDAITHYQVQERFQWADLVSLKLETGRTHQIRVHLASLGHPVFGDPEYGGRDQRAKGLFARDRAQALKLLKQLPYQALHAERLSFLHPDTKSEVSFHSPLPALLVHVLDDLRRTQ